MKENKSLTQMQSDLSGTCTQPRILKVVEIGDFWAKRTMPSIRLQGKWMQRAGILPNRYVRITSPKPGVLMIELQEIQISEPIAPMHLNHPTSKSNKRNDHG